MADAKSYPTIADAKALATKHRRRGVIVLSFGAGDYHAASYGMTRADCKAMAGVVDDICLHIGSGLIEIPDGFGREKVAAAEPGNANARLLAAAEALLKVAVVGSYHNTDRAVAELQSAVAAAKAEASQ